jgi:hypothetical protein
MCSILTIFIRLFVMFFKIIGFEVLEKRERSLLKMLKKLG